MKHDKDSEHDIPTFPDWEKEQTISKERKDAAIQSLHQLLNDRLPSGEPCREDEVAGLGALNLGRNDPFRKPAVLHDRLYDGIIAGTSDISQEEADKIFLKAMLAEADQHQLGYARAIFRYGIVRLVSLFRKVGK